LIIGFAIVGGGVGVWFFKNLSWGLIIGACVGCVIAIFWANKVNK